MKLRPNGFKKPSKRGPIDPIRQMQGKNRGVRQDPICCIWETRDELGSSHHGLSQATVAITGCGGLPRLAHGGCHGRGNALFP